MDIFQSTKTVMAHDLHALDELIVTELASKEPLVEQIADHIINSGGKRLRPLITLLFARLFNVPLKEAIIAATIIEFIHTATLLHDDVVDHAPLRRGKKSAHHIWGAEASVLVGDFLYSRAFQLMVRLSNLKIMQLLADTTNTIAEGEVMQLAQMHNDTLLESQYLNIIGAKTATLFAAAAQLGPLLAQCNATHVDACAHFGYHLGMAFQLADDALDYQADTTQTGKIQLKDLQEGKLTLPLIHALQQANSNNRRLLIQAIKQQDYSQLAKLHQLIIDTGGITYTYELATMQAQSATQAISKLPKSEYLDILATLADFATKRSF